MRYDVRVPKLSLIPILLREALGPRAFPREPEPDLVMEEPAQVAAFAEAGRVDGIMSASYLFNSARISQVIQGCRTVIDLGCGPATQLAQVAGLNPQIEFVGVDLSAGMLADAEAHVGRLGLKNVRFVEADVTTLAGIADQSAGAVISTLALHHLPTHAHLRACLRQVARVLEPGGALYLVDLGRLKSLRSILSFAYMNARHQPHLFSLDYERSLRASFLRADFERLSRECLPQDVGVYSTFGIAILIVAKTADRVIPRELRGRLQEMRRQLPRRYRRDLDDIRLFFRLGGLLNDPFSAP